MGCQLTRGHNSALRSVRDIIAAELLRYPTDSEVAEVLASLTILCGAMCVKTRQKARQATLARQYAVSLRTVKNWKRKGCPFGEGHRAVLGWMFQQRRLPQGPKEKFAKEFGRLRMKVLMADIRQSIEEVRTMRKLYRHYCVPVPQWMRGL